MEQQPTEEKYGKIINWNFKLKNTDMGEQTTMGCT